MICTVRHPIRSRRFTPYVLYGKKPLDLEGLLPIFCMARKPITSRRFTLYVLYEPYFEAR